MAKAIIETNEERRLGNVDDFVSRADEEAGAADEVQSYMQDLYRKYGFAGHEASADDVKTTQDTNEERRLGEVGDYAVRADDEADAADEVQNYMDDLYRKYGFAGREASANDVQHAESNGKNVDPTPVGPAGHDPAESCEPPVHQPKPAPETRSEIQALRELANRSAHSAITNFDSQQLVKFTYQKFGLSVLALFATVFLIHFNKPLNEPVLLTSGTLLIVALYWCGEFCRLTRHIIDMQDVETR
jgi:hypothetical protein